MIRKFKKKCQNIKAVKMQGLLSLRERKKGKQVWIEMHCKQCSSNFDISIIVSYVKTNKDYA